MASQSVTNKLVANIKQASDVSTNFFRGTNVVCIDTSNRRIGIDTKTPTWSIDISGVESYNGVKCHNLDISGKADISYALINFLKAPTISADNVNISFIYINELSGNLIDISEVIFNSISGDFIYSNNLIKGNTISGNLLEFTNGKIYNNFTICGELFADTYILGSGPKTFNGLVNISGSDGNLLVNNSASVNFNSINPVQYRTISGNHINTFSISCDNLQVTQESDFSSINVSAEASFNTINVIGEASFNTISAESIDIGGQSLQTLITETAGNNLNFTKEISLNTIYAKKIYIEKVDDETTLTNNYNKFFDEKSDYSNIDKLIIKSELDLSYNSATSLRLPYNSIGLGDREIGHIYYSKDATGIIDGIQIIKDKPNETRAGTTEPLLANVVTLKQSSTTSYMLELKSTNFTDYGNFKCVPMRTHTNSDSQYNLDIPIDYENSQFVNIDKIITDIIEINANITVSLTNDDNGKDVDAINYDFYIFGLHNTSNSIISNKKLVSNKNTILVFDNSYNYSSTSLHYIGKKKETNDPTLNINHIVFGISYENVPGKTLSLNLINFNASIKSIT